MRLPLLHEANVPAIFLVPLLAVFLVLLAGAVAALHAQSSPSMSIGLSPGKAVPANTEITATITLSNLDIDNYSSVVFRADVTGSGQTRDICEGDGIGKDVEIAVDASKEVLTATISEACPLGGSYALEARIFQVSASPSNERVELASARAPFVVSKYLMNGAPTVTPPQSNPQAWLDPDPTSLNMQVHGEWQRFFVRSDALESVHDHVYLYINDTGPGHFATKSLHYSTTVQPSVLPEQACRDQADDNGGWRRAIDQSVWVVACRPGDATFRLGHETEPVTLQRYDFRTLASTSDGGEPEPIATAAATVPGAPRSVVAGRGGSGELAVSWEAPSGDGGSAITGYKIQWKSGTEDYDSSRQAVVTDLASLTHAITGLTNGTEYMVRVIAYSQIGDGIPSTEAAGTPQSGPAVTIALSQSSPVVVGTEITVTMTFSNLEFDSDTSDADYGFRADVVGADECEGGGLGKDRYFYKVDEDPEIRGGTISAACPSGDYTLNASISSPEGVELAAAIANFTVVAPAQPKQQVAQPGAVIELSPSASVTEGTEIAVTMSFTNLDLDPQAEHTFRADVVDADACEGSGMGFTRHMHKVDEDPEVRNAAVSASCPAGDYTLEITITSSANVRLASASANFLVVAPTPVPTAVPTAVPTPAPTPEPTPAPTPVPTAAPTPEPEGLPSQLNLPTATMTDDGIVELSWDPVPEAASYEVWLYHYVVFGFLRRWVKLPYDGVDIEVNGYIREDIRIEFDGASATISNLPYKTSYEFVVRAVNDVGTSAQSPYVSVDNPLSSPTPEPTPAPTPEPTPAPTPVPTPQPEGRAWLESNPENKPFVGEWQHFTLRGNGLDKVDLQVNVIGFGGAPSSTGAVGYGTASPLPAVGEVCGSAYYSGYQMSVDRTFSLVGCREGTVVIELLDPSDSYTLLQRYTVTVDAGP